MTITITSYGHACFKIESGHGSIILDPYANNSVPGLSLPKNLHANVVSCSHQHADHNAKDLIIEDKTNIDFKIKKMPIPHDDKNGELRGMSDITIVNVDNKKIIHFGDIGRLPTNEEYISLKDADIIMISCGGYYTIDANDAYKIINEIDPDCTILMHYRKGDIGYDVLESIDNIKKIIPNIEEINSSSFVYDKKMKGLIITLEAKQ